MSARLVNLLRRHGVALVALFIALGGTSFAVTARHDQSDGHGRQVVLGCVGKNTGTLRIVDSFTRCGRLETPVSFNRQGVRGRTGHRGARGRNGVTGALGPQGVSGATGVDGPAGLDAVTATAAEAAGANCATGGVKLMSGIDADRNATLDPGEMNDAATRYICTGATGATGDTGEKGEKGDPGATGARAIRARRARRATRARPAPRATRARPVQPASQ